MNRLYYAVALLAALVLLMINGAGAQAQGIIIDPPPPGIVPPIGGPITIELHSIDAVIDGPVATVHITQIFRNNTEQQIEGTYIFPLPSDAAIGDFQMTVDGQVLEGKVYTKEEARRIYEDIVRRRRDPALLEYLDRDLFQTSVFPIPPGASRKLELTYSHTLALDNGLYHFRYPLQTRQYSPAPVKNLSLRVELRNQPGLRTIYSPSHQVRIDRLGDDAALVGFEQANILPERDFDLYFGVSPEAVGLNLLSYKPAGEDGFFLLLAAPGIQVAPGEVVQRDMILVMDISGSMEGVKMEQAKRAAHFLVDNLNPGDRFNLIAFSTGVYLWSAELRPTAEDAVTDAHRWIEGLRAGGSTDINRALLEALAQLYEKEQGRPAYILFMTDGLPTLGETDSGRIILNALNNMPPGRSVRLFAFGVGYDVDTDLLDNLSRELGGRSTYVKPEERIDEALGDFYRQISTPVLTNVSISFPGILVEDTYPYPIPDLFAGEQIVWAGRYRQGGATTITLRGEVNGKKRVFRYADQHLATKGGEPLVARLWATRKIGTLLDEIRRKGPLPELVDEVARLSTTYGIVTPYTSYLVLEPQFQPFAGAPDAAQPAAEVPMAPAAPREVVATVEV
ncbi:MAG: VWA domain-containing protein, partial [Caldilineae bacterium]